MRPQQERIFLLSPAFAGGRRAQMILNERAQFELAKKLRSKRGARITEVFTFLSGLYFRGKIAYASAFADPPGACPGVLVITTCRGLLTPETIVGLEDLKLFAKREICETDEAFSLPFARDVRALAECSGPGTDVILLGSIATGKYLKVLLKHLGPRLKFPRDFVGRGDMSRGGLLLRNAEEGIELDCISAEGAVLHGERPPKLAARRHGRPGPGRKETK